MPGRRPPEEDDYDDDPRPRRRSGNTGLVIALLVGGGVVALLLLGGCVGMLFWAGSSAPPPPVAAPQAPVAKAGEAKVPPTREEFRERVVGKSKDEIVRLLGRPAKTNAAAGDDGWEYEKVARDAATGKADDRTTLWFDAHGRVERVTP
jgi:uncharacterized membrane protein